MRTRIRTSTTWALIVATALLAGGCGGDGESAGETLPQPTLSRAVAEDLAARSDAIADALDAGDVCTAAVRADELLEATIEAINEGRVPQAFQEDLSARANELVNTVNCPPATTDEDDDNGDDDEQRGKNEKKEKKDKKGEGDGESSGDEEIVTLPTTTEILP